MQTAIDKANTDANKKFVLVAKGTYFADPEKKDKTKTFILKNGVKIYGGFDVSVEELKRSAQASILEGKLSNTLNTKQILKGENLSADTVLDGFVIQNALNTDTDSRVRGAGLYLYNSNPKLTNLVFKNNKTINSSYGGGGAIYNSSSSPNISNSTFSGNSAKNGGAIYNVGDKPNISNSTFNNNSAEDGGAIFNNSSNTNISNSTFSGNSAKNGGAIYNLIGFSINSISISISISNSTFSGNSAEQDGGAIYNSVRIWSSDSKIIINISNSILWDNKQTNTKEIINIINDNAILKPTIKNSILNKDSIAKNNTTIDTSATSNNQTPANFVIESDGKVTDAASKALIRDKGDNALYKATTGKEASTDKDLAGKPRLNGSKIDIGAYELQD